MKKIIWIVLMNDPVRRKNGIWEKTILPLHPGMDPEYRKPTGYALAVSADDRRIAGHFREYGDYYIPLVWENGGVQKLEDMLNFAGIFLDSGWYLAGGWIAYDDVEIEKANLWKRPQTLWKTVEPLWNWGQTAWKRG